LYHLNRARHIQRDSGKPLKTVWHKLQAASVEFRRGSFNVIASAPGIGKSAVALTLAVQSDATCQYHSADSGWSTQYARAGAMLTGTPVSEIQTLLNVKDPALVKYDGILQEALSRIRFDLDAGPSLDRIEDTSKLWLEIHGRWPQLIVLDNLSNAIDDAGGDGHVALENISAFLHEWARITNACIVALHHVTGEWESGDKPVPLGGLRGKVSKLPEVVLTLFNASSELDTALGPQKLGVAVVKNRNGRANPAGKMVVELDMDLNRMLIVDDIEEVEKWQKAAVFK
jgi:hypothetical protein